MKRGTTAVSLLVALAVLTAGTAVLSVATSPGNHVTAASTLRGAADATLAAPSFTATVTTTLNGPQDHESGRERIIYQAPDRFGIYRGESTIMAIGPVLYVHLSKAESTPTKNWATSRNARIIGYAVSQVTGWLTMLRQPAHVARTSGTFQARTTADIPRPPPPTSSLEGSRTPESVTILVRGNTVTSERIAFSLTDAATVPGPTRFEATIHYTDIGHAPPVTPPPPRRIMSQSQLRREVVALGGGKR